MSVEIRVPQLPESVADATLVAWRKQPGQNVSRDENLADVETDKVVLEVPSPINGVLREIKVQSGTSVKSGELLAVIDEAAAVAPAAPTPAGIAKAEAAAAVPRTGPAARRAAHGTSGTARAHDAAAGAYRRAPDTRTGHPGAAHHVQRSGPGRRAGTARTPQGQLREKTRREAGIHVVLRQGRGRGPQALSGGQCLGRKQRHRLSRVF